LEKIPFFSVAGRKQPSDLLARRQMEHDICPFWIAKASRWLPNLGMMKAAFLEEMGGRKFPIKIDIRFCCESTTK